MIEMFHNPKYDFIGKRRWAYLVSLAAVLISLTSMVVRGGLRYDIDFTGGTLIQVRTDPDAPKHAGLSELVVDMDSPGIEVHTIDPAAHAHRHLAVGQVQRGQ